MKLRLSLIIFSFTHLTDQVAGIHPEGPFSPGLQVTGTSGRYSDKSFSHVGATQELLKDRQFKGKGFIEDFLEKC